MQLKTKLDWQGYRLALQNEETMGCSPEQTAMCVAISDYRAKAHEMQEELRLIVATVRKIYAAVPDDVTKRAAELLADRAPRTDLQPLKEGPHDEIYHEGVKWLDENG